MVAVVEIGEVIKQADVEGLADRPQPCHQEVIETGKVIIFKRGDNGSREQHRALLHRRAPLVAPRNRYFRKDIERMFDPLIALFIKNAGLNEAVLDF